MRTVRKKGENYEKRQELSFDIQKTPRYDFAQLSVSVSFSSVFNLLAGRNAYD